VRVVHPEPDAQELTEEPGTTPDPARPTTMLWHPSDRDRVKEALRTALGALDERTRFSQALFDDPQVLGVADPRRLRDQIANDQAATVILRSLLDGGDTQQGIEQR
jgi:hypothetical protein